MSNELVTTKPDQALEFSAYGSEEMFVSAQRMAKSLYTSTIVPDAYRGEANAGNCIIAMELANRMGTSVLAVMQSLFLVHGKPGWSAAFMVACVNATKRFSPIRYKMTGEKGTDSWGCIAWATDKAGEVLESPEVTIKMAKSQGWYSKNGSKWPDMPQLMLNYRAATLFTRLYAPEITMGIQTTEEIADVLDVEATVTSAAPAAPSFKAKKPKETVVEVAPAASNPEPSRSEPPAVTPPVTAKGKAMLARAEAAYKPVPTPEPVQTEPEPPQAPQNEPEPPAAPTGESPAITDLRAAIKEGELTTEQVIAFAAKKGALKETADKDFPVLDDILDSKVASLAKMIRLRGGAYKEMKG